MNPKFPKDFKINNLKSLYYSKPEKIPKNFKNKIHRKKIIFLSKKIYVYLRNAIPKWKKLPPVGTVAKIFK